MDSIEQKFGHHMQADNCNKFKLCSNEKTNMDNKGSAEGYLEKRNVQGGIPCVMYNVHKKILWERNN